jgi:DNA-binding CsgD family transcriptional regulator
MSITAVRQLHPTRPLVALAGGRGSTIPDRFALDRIATPAALGAAADPVRRAWDSIRRGRLDAAVGDARAALQAAAGEGPPGELVSATSIVIAFLADALIERPELAGPATEAIRLSLHACPVGTPTAAWVLLGRGRVRLAGGDRAGATEDLRLAAALVQAIGDPPPDTWAWRSELALCVGADAPAQAIRLAESELADAWDSGSDRAIGRAQRALGTVGARDQRIATLRASVEALGRAGAPLELARSLVQLGIVLRRAGLRRDARVPLAAGSELAGRCGALATARHARAELELLGSRRRGRHPGLAGLTASEARVARLAANGMTNRQIAGALFVEIRTVTTHLTSIYRKLDIGGREQLAAQLAPAAIAG